MKMGKIISRSSAVAAALFAILGLYAFFDDTTMYGEWRSWADRIFGAIISFFMAGVLVWFAAKAEDWFEEIDKDPWE